MPLAVDKVVLPDNAWRNLLRQVPPNSVLYMPGLEGGGTTVWDYSGNGNHGTITGATWVRLSSGVWAKNFDGNDYINCGTASNLQIATGFLECWFRTDQLVGTHFIMGAPCRNVGWAAPWVGFQMAYSVNDIRWYGAVGGVYQTTITGVAQLASMVWAMLTITWDGTTAQILKNGAVVKSDATLGSGNITYGTSPSFVIGVHSADDLSEYLSDQSQVALEHAGTVVPTEAQVLARFNQTKHLFGI